MSSENEVHVEPFSLDKIDEVATKLQIEGKYVEALEQMERSLVMRSDQNGLDSEQVWENIKSIASICNSLSMQYLQHEEFAAAADLLKRAEELTKPRGFNRFDADRLKIRAITYNNLGCLHRRQNKLKQALAALEKAAEIEGKIEDVVNPAGTHLNICAVLSQLGRHTAALEHAQAALMILQDELFSTEVVDDRIDRMAVLAIAFHNFAVEQEFLHKHAECLRSYTKAYDVANTYLGPTHDITAQMEKAKKEAYQKLSRYVSKPKGHTEVAKGSRPPTAKK